MARKMTDIATLVVAVAVLLGSRQTAAAQAQGQRPDPAIPTVASAVPGGMVEIDGAKTPDALPDYVVWTQGLSAFSIIKRDNIVTAMQETRLSDADLALALAEGERQDKRDTECADRTRPIAESMRGQKVEKIEAAVRPEVLKCRWAVLDAADRLLASMSPDGRIALTAWIMDRRKGIKVYVPKSDLEFFKQPR